MVVRPENDVSFAVLKVNDYKSKNYVDVFDPLVGLTIYLRYGSGSWTTVFSGTISSADPQVSQDGEFLEVGAWGFGNALIKTYCNQPYGVESINKSTYDTPKEIIDDLITHYINHSLGTIDVTGYGIVSKVDNAHAGLSIKFLANQYVDNYTVVNRICDITSAYAAGLAQASVHWFVDPSGNLYFKQISADHTDGNWDHYWGGMAGTDPGTAASSTIVVKEDMIIYDFKKNIEEYANHILLYSAYRNPSEDWLTEDGGPAWGTVDATATYSAAQFIVGSHSLLLEPTNSPNMGIAYYPSTRDLGLNVEKFGSPTTIPTLSFYVYANDTAAFGYPIYLFTDCIAIGGASNDYFWAQLDQYMTPRADKWVHLELPIGPYYALQPELQLDTGGDEFEWNITGNPSWTNINGIALLLEGNNNYDKYFDDMHFSGAMIRAAQDTAEIAANNAYQKFIRYDGALNDSLRTTVDTGTAARLVYAELLRRAQTPIVGTIRIPLAPTILPGQTMHIHACQQASGTYRIDSDMRVKEIRHYIGFPHPFTTLNLTNDVMNSHAFAAPTGFGLLKSVSAQMEHKQARDLKTKDIDWQIPIITTNY